MSEKDPGRIMEEMAIRAVMHSKKRNIDLDFSEGSVQQVEEIMTELEKKIPKGLIKKIFKKGPSEAEIEDICNMYGAYLGEIMRKNMGGEWGYNSDFTEGEKIFCLNIGKATFFPPAKVHKRLFQGKGDNVWFYYQVIKAQIKSQTQTLPS